MRCTGARRRGEGGGHHTLSRESSVSNSKTCRLPLWCSQRTVERTEVRDSKEGEKGGKPNSARSGEREQARRRGMEGGPAGTDPDPHPSPRRGRP